jgi:hypothetical protein
MLNLFSHSLLFIYFLLSHSFGVRKLKLYIFQSSSFFYVQFLYSSSFPLKDWQLQIKFVQLRDAGSYECAISSYPSISLFVQLHVNESKAKIEGPPERYLKPGSLLRLTCKILDNIENPQFIFWYQNSRMVNYDSHLGINVTVQLGMKKKFFHNLNFPFLIGFSSFIFLSLSLLILLFPNTNVHVRRFTSE